MAVNLLKFLLSDNESIEKYLQSRFVSLDDIKMRIMLKYRSYNSDIPDHIYRLYLKETFKGISSLSDIFLKGLYTLSDDHLEIVSNKVYVKQEQQNNWQELITFIPPLFLQSLILYQKTFNDNCDILKYYTEVVIPNTKYTAIPSPKIQQLDFFVDENSGLSDLHMHLNGTLETDQVWQDYLRSPLGIYKDLKKGFANARVKEQLEQESHLLEPQKFIKLLKIAQKIREFFFDYLYLESSGNSIKSPQLFLNRLVNNSSSFPGGYLHPFLSIVNSSNKDKCLMPVEALMYLLVLDELNKKPNELLSSLLHLYLLILGLTNRLLVQQTHQNGFEQFQKHTLNELREKSERTYMRRYFQLQGNDLKFIRFLEGRFSPKSTQHENIFLIDSIYKGWNKMKGDIESKNRNNINFKSPELKLIAHFIKKADLKPHPYIRHREQRLELMQKGKILSLLLKNHPNYRKKIVGIDAAASEFDANPEAFAPVFRYMRKSGIQHFTYHAGEDFYHILDGLRAIFEAINFCDLRKGDRIGHATATGLSVDDWAKVVGDEIILRKGDYLDNLVFAYHIIIKFKINALHSSLPFIINEVQNLGYSVYNKYYPIAVLESAWLMRECCPLHSLETEKDTLIMKGLYDQNEWELMQNKHYCENIESLRNSDAYEVFQKYHNKEYRANYESTYLIDPFAIINREAITQLQLSVLQFMTNKEIVIETLPTSNVRIGFHKDFSTYHLKNWLYWKRQGKAIPPIVVGSDDTGVFATNIYNEFANIYCSFINNGDVSHDTIMKIIKDLDTNSKVYKFG